MKDDIESFTYMLIHLGRGRLPWLYVDVKPGDNYINIFNCKRTIDSRELAGSLPYGFVKLIDYARGMDALDTPDYEYMRDIFRSMSNKKTYGNVLNVVSPNSDYGDHMSKKNMFIKARSSNYTGIAPRPKSAQKYDESEVKNSFLQVKPASINNS